MKRLVPILVATSLGAAALACAGPVSASADDQATADAAIAGFNERLTEAGGESSGPPDTTPIDPEEYAAENPGSECFGEFATGLDPGGQVEGETARADGDHFSLPGDDGTDEVDASVVVVDEDHADIVRDFVDEIGSEDVATCLEEAFGALLESEAASAEEGSDETLPEYSGTIEVDAESDIGVGDASAHVRIGTEITYGDESYTSNVDLYVAVSGRSLAGVTVVTVAEPATDFDPVAELEALVDSL
jgi:hypothetical protein